MEKKIEAIFVQLFKQAVKEYFTHALDAPLTENESKLFCVEVEEKTGLVLGFKSIKNYSIFIFGDKDSMNVNPSLATLDTLARYVLKAPATTEADRKKSEDHYPFWNLYQKQKRPKLKNSKKLNYSILWAGFLGVLTFLLYFLFLSTKENDFNDDFSMLDAETLLSNSWMLLSEDSTHWQLRDEEQGYLKLYTLESDNWPDSTKSPEINNLLVRPVNSTCFSVEAHIENFFPKERWQQAGIILMNDTSFSENNLRLSIAYNDFFGGYDRPPEIIVQGVITGIGSNPEEFVHHQLFQIKASTLEIVGNNLSYCRLRLEKNKTELRVLIATGSMPNTPYKEIERYTSNMNPRYVGIFALKGKVKESSIIPVKFDSFEIKSHSCE